jgi:O-Antigen ligase
VIEDSPSATAAAREFERSPRPLGVLEAAEAIPAALTVVAVAAVASAQGGYFPTSWGWASLGFLTILGVCAIPGGLSDAGKLDVGFLGLLILLTAWVGASTAWSIDPAQSVLELERWLTLVSGCAAFLVVVRRLSFNSVVVGLVLAVTGVSVYSLLTRLVPDHFGTFDPNDPISGYRLAAPIGYWNGLGIFDVMGILLALGIATNRDARPATRAVGTVALALLPTTLYFTFSRASMLTLAVGFLAMIALAGHRVRFITESVLFALIPVMLVVLASHEATLTQRGFSLAATAHQGHRFGIVVAAMAAAAGASAWGVSWLERRLRLRKSVVRVYALLLVLAPLLALSATLVHAGGPLHVVRRGYDSFISTAQMPNPSNLNGRLLTLNANGRLQLWRVALDADHGHWLTGRGAGSFERTWDRSPAADDPVRDAHSLYVETLSELGIPGLLLLAAALLLPLVAGIRARATPLVPALIAAYAAFLLHNAVDWDWELSGVALTGLFIGALLVISRRSSRPRPVPVRGRLVLLALLVPACGFAAVAIVGNTALARADSANNAHRYADAASEARLARSWMPWSPDPLIALGAAELEGGDVAGSISTFNHAIRVDPDNWQAWLDLATSERGASRAAALEQAESLYPRSPEIAAFKNEIGWSKAR